MIDQIRRDIQARLDELLGEADTLQRALAALSASESEKPRGDRAAPASGAAGESAVKSVGARTRRAPRASRTSEKPAGPAAAPAPARTAQGATRAAVLAALADGSAMTAGEIAAATGLGRATVSAALSKLASSGQVAKAARGYQLGRESERARKPARRRPSASTVAEPQVAEPAAAEPEVAEPSAVEPEVAEPSAVEPEVAEPEVAESQAVEPKASGPARSPARSSSGATKHVVLGALAGGSAMTTGEVAAATGLARASVSATFSQLAKAGEVTKAARGYQIAGVEAAQRFYFRAEDETAPGAVAANLPELEAAIAVCGPGVLREHCAEHDFSRWVAGVLRNEPLAAEIAAAEAQLSGDTPTETVEWVRLALIAALQARHATQR